MSKYIDTKEEVSKLIDEQVDNAIESLAGRMAAIHSQLKLTESIPVGKVKFNEKQEYVQNYETASWHTDYEIEEGEYELNAYINYYSKHQLNLFYYAKGKCVEHYTQSSFGGVPVGKAIDSKNNSEIGKERDLTINAGGLNKLEDGTLKVSDNRVAIIQCPFSERVQPIFVLNPNSQEMIEQIENNKEEALKRFSDIYQDINYMIKQSLKGTGKSLKTSFYGDIKIQGMEYYDLLKSIVDTPENREKFKDETLKKFDEKLSELNERINNSPFMKYHQGNKKIKMKLK